ncbi:hypothetical protein N431DRAFT_560526 [Stipitochalara longipes BDJ]|nr:hypothetical protein N431DRAFT_560526 [Stipitochalara longipes BDJ]
MSQVQTCEHIRTTLQPRPGSWISSNDINDLVNREMNFVVASSTSSEEFLTQSHQDPYRFQRTNQSDGSGHLVLFQEVQITPSTPSHDIIAGQNMDSIVETPVWEQISDPGQPSPSSHPKSATQTKNGNKVVHAAVDPRQHANQDLPIPNRPPTAEDWQAYRKSFTQLYKVENKTLREVMGIMKEQYNFRASPRMFKHRIKEWRLNKNYTAAERKHLAQIIKDCEEMDETCSNELLIQGQPVKAHRIQRDKMKLTGNSQIALEDLRKRLALSSMPVKPLATLASHKHTEILLLQTKLYCESYIQLAVHGAVDDDPISSGIFCNKIDAALTSLERGQPKEGWHMLHEASDLIRPLFTSNDKSILRLLLRFAQRWYKSATPELFKVLWTHISDMASTILSHNNPITLVCVSITHIGGGYEVCETAFGLMLSEFEQSLGSDHERTLEIKDLYQSLLLESGKFDAAELLQRQLLHHYGHINEYSHSSVWAAYGLGLVLEKKGDFLGAEEAYQSASLRGNICNGERFPTQDDIYVLQHLVRMLSRRNEYAECADLLGHALIMCMENNEGPTDGRMQQILGELDEISWKQESIREAGIS